MTESEWANCTDPGEMLAFVQNSGLPSVRKHRLLAVACCRRLWHLLDDVRSRTAVEVAERCADEAVDGPDLLAAWNDALDLVHEYSKETDSARWVSGVALECLRAACGDVHRAITNVTQWICPPVRYGPSRPQHAQQAALLRDLFGNPFDPLPAVDPTWLAWSGGTVRRLAEATYQERSLPDGTLDLERLAVLVDALLDAGCPPDHRVLLHLREQGPHIRGCVALDALLGRA
jgi:hypothetical protein